MNRSLNVKLHQNVMQFYPNSYKSNQNSCHPLTFSYFFPFIFSEGPAKNNLKRASTLSIQIFYLKTRTSNRSSLFSKYRLKFVIDTFLKFFNPICFSARDFFLLKNISRTLQKIEPAFKLNKFRSWIIYDQSQNYVSFRNFHIKGPLTFCYAPQLSIKSGESTMKSWESTNSLMISFHVIDILKGEN